MLVTLTFKGTKEVVFKHYDGAIPRLNEYVKITGARDKVLVEGIVRSVQWTYTRQMNSPTGGGSKLGLGPAVEILLQKP